MLGAVNEIETLATGLSGKIWQKISLLERAGEAGEVGYPEFARSARRYPDFMPATAMARNSVFHFSSTDSEIPNSDETVAATSPRRRRRTVSLLKAAE